MPPQKPENIPDEISDNTSEEAARQAVIDGALKINELGLNRGAAGNVSVRTQGGFLITPTGMAYDALTPADISALDQRGKPFGARKPSSEWHIHHNLYQSRPEIGAIVHCHAIYCTALACLKRNIPAFHYMVAVAGGSHIRCADYATFGSEQLSHNVATAMDRRKACLMAHHGMIAAGQDLPEALHIASEVETLAEQYHLALQIGDPEILSGEEMEIVLEKFAGYGQHTPPAPTND